MAWRAGRHGARGPVLGVRPLLALLVAVCLFLALAGGLLRLGVALPGSAAWVGHAAVWHGVLMVAGFFATVIGIERAVAVKLRWAFLAPLLSAAGGLGMAAGWHAAGAWAVVLAAHVFCAVNAVVVYRQWAAHTWLLLAGAVALFLGNLLHAMGWSPQAAVSFWFAFLVITIAAERLEMTRLMRRRHGAQPLLVMILGTMLGASLLTIPWPVAGGVLFGVALVALAVWLAAFDVARRTVRAQGLPRYMAVALLAGYAWLAVSGVAWAGTSLGMPWRDAALHALGLGFVFSMVMAHAPVILPAVARVKLAFGAWFYVPLVLLHVSVLWRLGPGLADGGQRAAAAIANLAAVACFMLAMAYGALVWRRTHR